MEKIEGQKVTENIYLCPDGKYRWVYELNMINSPVILFTIWKIFGIVLLVLLAFMLIIEIVDGNVVSFVTDTLLSPGILIIPGIMLVLSIIGYGIVAAAYGFKYIVLFEMDEKTVVHNQMPKQFKKAEGLAWLAAMLGAVAGSYPATGAGILAGSKSSSVSRFDKVRTVVRRKGQRLIEVNEPVEKNQVYAEDADYEFVWNYITSRCPNAKVK